MTIATVVLAASLTIAGCSAPTPDLASQKSESWQAHVVAIAEYAAAGDPATALQDLATLEAEALQARASGEISAERAAIIQQAIVQVRADLEIAIAESTVPPPEDTPAVVVDPGSGSDGSDGNGVEGNSGNDDDGNNGNGNGNDGKNENNGNNGNGNGNGNDD